MKNLEVVRRIARNINRRLTSYRDPTVFNLLRSDKEPIQQQERTRVYRIPIDNIRTQEEASYIGVTVRNLKKRLYEHKENIRQGKLTTALATEAYSEDLNIKWE